jgi:uncharacterized RmlC-like cupin family protein
MAGASVEAAHDSVRLQAALDELRATHGLLSQFAETTAEMPGLALEHAAGISASAALVALRIGQAQARCLELAARRARSGVVVLDPARGSWTETSYGQTVLPLVTASRVDGVLGVCSGVSRIAAGGSSGVRVHPDIDVIMVAVFGAAVIHWWDSERRLNHVTCRRHQHAHIPRGTPHAVSNPGSVPMLAVLVHSGADLTIKAERMAELDCHVPSRAHVQKEPE